MEELTRPLLRKELATASGVNAETLRFYEKVGVLRPERSPKGYRVYGPEDLKRLRLIQRALSLGFPLEAVKAWLGGDSAAIGSALAALDRKATELEKLRKNLRKRLRGTE
ncbi:MAG: MerR family transcriptional regulator [Bryobacter sp.]|nr:MerR family transcriptional regulator [Bryobacter sp.]